jgi:hypothetical protein
MNFHLQIVKHQMMSLIFLQKKIQKSIFQLSKQIPLAKTNLKLYLYRKTRPTFAISISEDIQEIKTDLMQSRDLLGKIVPTFKLRWRAEGEGIEDLNSSEKLHFNIKKIIQVRELQVNTVAQFLV